MMPESGIQDSLNICEEKCKFKHKGKKQTLAWSLISCVGEVVIWMGLLLDKHLQRETCNMTGTHHLEV